MNDALLSNSLQFASGGVGPLVTLWAKTRGNLDVKAVSAINSMPLHLVSRNPAVKTVRDFTDKDRIGLPAVKVSVQAVTLQMAAAKEFGDENYAKLDRYRQINMRLAHPEGLTDSAAHSLARRMRAGQMRLALEEVRGLGNTPRAAMEL